MKVSLSFFPVALLTCACFCSSCKTTPYNYDNLRAYKPHSILILPPINESTDIRGTYGYLSTITMPIAELGYYVYPVAMMDHFFKENGMPLPGDMHQAPLDKIHEITGADSVLYINLKQYLTRYMVLNSVTTVTAEARLVSTKDGTVLWHGTVMAQQDSSGGSGNIIASIIGAAFSQIVSKATDRAHDVSGLANQQYGLKDRGLLVGPYHPAWLTPLSQ